MRNKWLWLSGVGGLIIGVVAVLAAEQVDRATSTQEFCTSCHSMAAHVAQQAYYRESVHRSNPEGVVAGCGDCHIPPGLVPATWTHVKEGVQDLYATVVRDLDTPEQWAARRAHLTESARAWFEKTDSVTCRRCHDMASIEPVSNAGQVMHQRARQQGTTCVACHRNLVHPPPGDES